jgi:hypothetical protein
VAMIGIAVLGAVILILVAIGDLAYRKGWG